MRPVNVKVLCESPQMKGLKMFFQNFNECFVVGKREQPQFKDTMSIVQLVLPEKEKVFPHSGVEQIICQTYFSHVKPSRD